MIPIAICDDTAMEAEFLQDLLGDYAAARGLSFAVSRYQSAEALGEVLAAGQGFRLCFLDVILPGADGLSFARGLGAGAPPLVFLSSSPEFGPEARSVGAAGYLEKPVGKAALFPLLDALLTAPAPVPMADEWVPVGGGRRVNLAEVQALSQAQRRFVLKDGGAVPVSRLRWAAASRAWMDWLRRQGR